MNVRSIFLVGVLALVAGCSSITDSLNQRAGAAEDPMDTRLRVEILGRLQSDAVTMHQAYGIAVQDGMVRLTGVAANDMVRYRAISIIQNTPGVRQVDDRMTQ